MKPLRETIIKRLVKDYLKYLKAKKIGLTIATVYLSDCRVSIRLLEKTMSEILDKKEKRAKSIAANA